MVLYEKETTAPAHNLAADYPQSGLQPAENAPVNVPNVPVNVPVSAKTPKRHGVLSDNLRDSEEKLCERKESAAERAAQKPLPFPNRSALTAEEQALLESYRALSAKDKGTLNAMLDHLAPKAEEEDVS